MQKFSTPFNIGLLHLTPEKLRGLKQVTALDHFDGGTDFHPKGLFSTEIFGRVGDERRNLLYGYIDIKAEVFHPLVFMALTKLKRMYGDIMAGRAWALWDEGIKDFVRGKPSEGARTGFAFFFEHWKDINHRESDSTQRMDMIKLLKEHADRATTSKIVVMPAGLRELEIDEFGRKTEDEVNTLYRSMMSSANVIVESSLTLNPAIVDKPRYDIQLKFCELYDMIEALIKGKKKLFLGKVASRRIFNGTRNVITAMNTAVTKLGKKGAPDFNSTIVGLYQYLQATAPVSTYQLHQFLAPMFPDANEAAILVDPKTLTPRDVFLQTRYFDRWATTEGLEKVIASFKEEDIRNQPILIDGYYIGLLYLGPDGTFRFFQDIRELPQGRLKEHVRPLTLTDLMYLAVYRHASKYPAFVTRYPVTGIGSIYPSKTHLRVTVGFQERRMLDDAWTDAGDDFVAYEFPDLNSAFVNSMIPHSSHLGRLGADFDGDTSSCNIAYSDEAIREADGYFKTKRAYISTEGRLLYSCNIDTVKLVAHNMTGEPDMTAAIESIGDIPAGWTDSTGKVWGEEFLKGTPVVADDKVSYTFEDIVELAKTKPVQTVNVGDIQPAHTRKLDPYNLLNAKMDEPLVCFRTDGVLKLIDGYHRLHKLNLQGVQEAKIQILDEDEMTATQLKSLLRILLGNLK